MHSSIRGSSRLCDSCQAKAARRARELSEHRRAREAQERESWPPADHDDRVRSVSAFPPPEQRVRPIPVSGAELASCLLEGGVAPRAFTTVRKRLFRTGTTVRKRIEGWAMPHGPSGTSGVATSGNGAVTTLILAKDGTQWRHRENTLVRVRPKKEMYDGVVLGQLYRRSDTFEARAERVAGRPRRGVDPPDPG